MKALSARAILAAAALTMLVPGIGHAGTRGVSSTYVGTTVLTVGHGCDVAPVVPEVPELSQYGGACFALDGDETTASFVVADGTKRSIGGSSYFLSGSTFIEASLKLFCRSDTVTVPEGATSMYVALDAAVTPVMCLADSGPATVGTIDVTFTLAEIA